MGRRALHLLRLLGSSSCCIVVSKTDHRFDGQLDNFSNSSNSNALSIAMANRYIIMNPIIVKKLMAVGILLTLFGCGHLHGPLHHSDYVNRPNYYPSYHHYYPSYYNSYPSNFYHYKNEETINQNINNTIINKGPNFYEGVRSESRSFYLDENPSAFKTGEDGTIGQVVIEEKHKYLIPNCRTSMQAVNAKHYNSFQYSTC